MVTLAAACMLTSTNWPAAGHVPGQQGGEQRHHRVVAAGLVALVAAAPHRGELVVVVAAGPDRPAGGQHGEVDGGGVLAASWP